MNTVTSYSFTDQRSRRCVFARQNRRGLVAFVRLTAVVLYLTFHTNMSHGQPTNQNLSAIDPNHEGFAKRAPCLLGRTDEIGNRVGAGINHAIAQPAHASRMLDAILAREAEVFADIGTYRIGIEMHGV